MIGWGDASECEGLSLNHRAHTKLDTVVCVCIPDAPIVRWKAQAEESLQASGIHHNCDPDFGPTVGNGHSLGK